MWKYYEDCLFVWVPILIGLLFLGAFGFITYEMGSRFILLLTAVFFVILFPPALCSLYKSLKKKD